MKYPKAVAKIADDQQQQQLAFYDFPAEHWVHLKITIRPSQPWPPYGCGPMSARVRAAGLAMAYELLAERGTTPCRRRSRRLDEAETCHRRALSIRREIRDRFGEAVSV